MFLGFDFVIAFVFLLGAVSAWVPRRGPQAMRYLKPALVGLVGGLLLAITVAVVEFLIGSQRLAGSMMECRDAASTSMVAACDGAEQFGDVRYLGIAFVVGFAVAFIWSRRRQQRRVS